MSTKPDTRQIPDDILQAAIDAALIASQLTGFDSSEFQPGWTSQSTHRLALARGLLARLPGPPPPVSADGKTPGQVAFENFQQRGLTAWSDSSYQKNYEAAASAVLAAFGRGGLEAAIARMEAVPVEELDQLARHLWTETSEWAVESAKAVRARLIAAARDGQGEAVDWKAKYEEATKECDKLKVDCDRMSEQEVLSLSQLRPIAEAGPVPEGCVRVTGYFFGDDWALGVRCEDESDTHVADIRLPAASQDSQPATFEAHGKTWTKHVPGDPMPCDGEAFVDCVCEGGGTLHATRAKLWSWSGDIIGWRYADEPTPAPAPAWQPAVGEPVRLVSGGPVMAVNAIESKGLLDVIWISPDGCLQSASLAAACLTPAKEAQP